MVCLERLKSIALRNVMVANKVDRPLLWFLPELPGYPDNKSSWKSHLALLENLKNSSGFRKVKYFCSRSFIYQWASMNFEAITKILMLCTFYYYFRKQPIFQYFRGFLSQHHSSSDEFRTQIFDLQYNAAETQYSKYWLNESKHILRYIFNPDFILYDPFHDTKREKKKTK